MPDLKIRVFKGDGTEPDTTVTIPGGVLKVASRLMPKKAREALQEKGIEPDEIVKLAEEAEVQGTLVEVDDHQKGEKVIISLE